MYRLFGIDGRDTAMFVNLYILIRYMFGKDAGRFTAIISIMLTVLVSASVPALAQDSIQTKKPKAQLRRETDRTQLSDSLADSLADKTTIQEEEELSVVAVDMETIDTAVLNRVVTLPSPDSLITAVKAEFVPDSKKAMWLAIVFPGGGQIYNRKYWKLPLIYGGFMGCVYALSWNNMMYRDYSKAYIDIMDDDPNTKSYEAFIPKGYDINKNLTRIQDLFRRKKNYYRRYRDLSMFCMIGVYALSIIDAYVDAELSSFDISKDLSMKVRPSIIHDRNSVAAISQSHNPYACQSYGVQCSLNF